MTPKDLRIGAWSKLSLPVTVTSAALCEESADKPELWIGCSDGHVYQLQDVSAATYATAASTSAVSASFETHPLPLGPQTYDGAVTGRGEPRYVEVESYSSTGITWTVTVTVLSSAEARRSARARSPWCARPATRRSACRCPRRARTSTCAPRRWRASTWRILPTCKARG